MVVGMTVFFIAMPVCLVGSLQTRNEACNVPNSIAALYKKVLQLKIGSNTKCSIDKACSVGLHKPFFS